MPPSRIGEGKAISAVLFIHGLGGSYSTWGKFAEHLESQWQEVDCYGLEYDTYYKSKSTAWYPKILKMLTKHGVDKLARNLKTAVEQLCYEYEHVIIIGHSMGGLIARRHIIDIVEETKSTGKIKALITYATPHHGSLLANIFMLFAFPIAIIPLLTWPTTQISHLRRNSNFINTLNKKWSSLRIDDKIDFLRVVGSEDRVVDVKSSAYKSDPNVHEIVGRGHSELIIPDTSINKDKAFLVTYNYLKDFHSKLKMVKEVLEEENYYEEDEILDGDEMEEPE